MAKRTEFFSGKCEQILFSPRGSIEGLLLMSKTGLVQISIPPEAGDVVTRKLSPGKRLRILATRDRSERTAAAIHPVYVFGSFADSHGAALPLPASGSGTTIKGKVASLHFAKHGEPNGVILESGDFVHLKPHGMAQLAPQIGSRLTATGEMRMTVLGTRLLEAHSANGVDL